MSEPTSEAQSQNEKERPAGSDASSGGAQKKESLEDLLSTLSKQINSSDWLQQNTAEKFASENPEVAQAFRDVAAKKEVEEKAAAEDQG